MEQLDQAAIDKVSGRAWDELRGAFLAIAGTLLDVGNDTGSKLTTIYVKFTVGRNSGSPVYAVAWVKSSKKLIVGLALPENLENDLLGPAPPGTKYKGLTKYFSITQGEQVPEKLTEWAKAAYENVAEIGQSQEI